MHFPVHTNNCKYLTTTCQVNTRLMSQGGPADQGQTIFDKILDGSIPAQFLHQDDKCVAFKDVAPQAPVHFLIIPRKRIPMIEQADDQDSQLLGHLLLTARAVAKDQGLDKGYR